MDKPVFDTKIAIVLEKGLLPWQELNVTAFLASTIANRFPETMGKDFVDASGGTYPGMFRQPVLVFQAESEELKSIYQKAISKDPTVSIYIRDIFQTQGDQNLEAVAKYTEEEQDYVGLALYGGKSKVDRVLKGIKLHS